MLLGPGDDAAILQLANQAGCVVTVDLLTEGVDFNLAEVSAKRVGRKALAVSLSDLAAMAARPVGMVVAVALPKQGGGQLAVDLFEGMAEIANEYQTAVAGGDTNSWDGPLVISVTAIGETTAAGTLTRSGAKPGDRILLTGSFGGSILGKHLDFEPRMNEALQLAQVCHLHAGIDVSDGLSLDLSRVATESGCGALIDLSRVPISDAAYELTRRQADDRTARSRSRRRRRFRVDSRRTAGRRGSAHFGATGRTSPIDRYWRVCCRAGFVATRRRWPSTTARPARLAA